MLQYEDHSSKFKTIKDNDLIDTTFISKINPNKEHFIYFNNLETDFNNIRYHPKYSSDDETFTSDEDVSIKGGTDTQQKDDISQKYTSELLQDQPKTQESNESEQDIESNKNENENEPKEDKSTEDKLTEDKPKENEPTEDKSTENKPTEDKPTEEDKPKEENELTEENISLEEPDYSSIEDETSSDNMNMPSAVFDAKCLYHILEKINK